jgi:hypothetical protein
VGLRTARRGGRRNIRDAWWKRPSGRDDVVGVEATIITSPKGGRRPAISRFTDPMVDAAAARARHRSTTCGVGDAGHAAAGCRLSDLRQARTRRMRQFFPMFRPSSGRWRTRVGRLPAATRRMFINFDSVLTSSRLKRLGTRIGNPGMDHAERFIPARAVRADGLGGPQWFVWREGASPGTRASASSPHCAATIIHRRTLTLLGRHHRCRHSIRGWGSWRAYPHRLRPAPAR